MDDKKINLMPENLRSREDKSKRPIFKFDPDFKISGKKEKFKEPKLSGGQVSWWSKLFKHDQKPKKATSDTPTVSALGQGIKYNNDDKTNSQPKVVSIDMRVPEKMSAKIEEHIQDFVPEKAKLSKENKPHGPSFWSRFLAMFKSKPKAKKSDSSALSNGLKYNGNGVHQPEAKPSIKVLQELNKSAESADSNDLKPKKINDQVSVTTQPETNFDLTKKVSEEVGLAPLQPVSAAPLWPVSQTSELPKAEAQPIVNDFAMPIAPKAVEPEPKMASIEDNTDIPKPLTTGPKFHMPEVGEKNSLLSGIVDLIPVAAKVRSWKQIGSLLAFGLVLSLAILGGLYGYLMLEQQKIIGNQNNQKQQISEIEKKILTFSELNKNINTLGQEIRVVQDALNKHIYWTHFFSLLEKYTVSDVYYSGLAVGTNGGLTLNASTNSYDSVAKQLKVLNSEKAQEFVEEASITSAKQDKDGAVSFQIILSLNQDLFYYSQEN
ncbi:MAG: hypothetical protein WCV69_01595 [Patescibacteria group bacterium]|jgi:Tfp pilus assembly protein PilN